MVTLIAPVTDEKAGKVVLEDTEITYDPEKCELKVNKQISTASTLLYMLDFTLKSGVREFAAEIR